MSWRMRPDGGPWIRGNESAVCGRRPSFDSSARASATRAAVSSANAMSGSFIAPQLVRYDLQGFDGACLEAGVAAGMRP